jgi:hypothetical protein
VLLAGLAFVSTVFTAPDTAPPALSGSTETAPFTALFVALGFCAFSTVAGAKVGFCCEYALINA